MNVRWFAPSATLLVAACADPAVVPQSPGATYEATITLSWSEATHPLDGPGLTAAFTQGIGATQSDGYSMFGIGKMATPGLEMLSQKGQATPFDEELAAAAGRGTVGETFRYRAIWTAGATATVRLRAIDAFPTLSFANMVAPSPDWFTGVASLPRQRDGQWIESETVTLHAWDSGTKGARTYRADKIALDPFVPTRLNDESILLQGVARVPVGTATVRKVGDRWSSVSCSDGPHPSTVRRRECLEPAAALGLPCTIARAMNTSHSKPTTRGIGLSCLQVAVPFQGCGGSARRPTVRAPHFSQAEAASGALDHGSIRCPYVARS